MKTVMWRDIKDYEGVYKISNTGMVKSVERFVYKTGTSVPHYIQREKIIKPYKSAGYWKVDLYRDSKRERKFVHVLLGLHFIANPLNLPQINHKDGNKLNFELDNLEWSNQSQNMKHAYNQLGFAGSNKGKFGRFSHSSKQYCK